MAQVWFEASVQPPTSPPEEDMEAMKAKAKEAIDNQMAAAAPRTLKALFPVCGGPVGTLDKCMCCVPADKREELQNAIDKYKTM